YFLMAALRQNNGANSIGKIYAYLTDQVSKAVAARNSGSRGVSAEGEIAAPAGQTPVLSTSQFGGDIVLGITPASARLAPAQPQFLGE
ncbi:MAG TPA: hypothetical protein VEJ39_00245, partial [Candidatus Acidoferrales bacterium]|nr:hypothetical protein [Candidatus Acidoferrales bacterium]